MYKQFLVALSAAALFSCGQPQTKETETAQTGVWDAAKANEWYAKQGWLVGANYITGSAINQLEMWQAETFDTAAVDRELGLAAGIGMNTMRVFLHDLLHQQDPEGYFKRMEQFLQIADKHKIRIMFVLFDSVWDPNPVAGKQRDPRPHVHNSGWVQSPGIKVLQDSTQYPRLEKYVTETVKKFANDPRVVCWDVWNEPDNPNVSAYGPVELKNKVDYVLPLLGKVFAWARAAAPVQPLTSGVWAGNWEADSTLKPIERLMIAESDVISFHTYDDSTEVEKRIAQLKRYQKPLICTEYMARPRNSTFESILPIFKKHKVAAYNWGFIEGKSQTNYPWDTWTKQYTAEPELWFHDIFRKNGEPYRQTEVDFIRQITKQ
ncbi:1,4-beta-xylanase [Chitinophaga lutea]|uniref:1,4-beta-xylanase n=1 Tax=Chitinophaga lutea TaxID=2488634 RepID=A0A3N4PBY7_9BACT|nr:cellulase family glycosylhydrolase [Chitinophaga lutea]RPE05746.1 1,4-beta-xylanase [Chitinophaga lutea]